MTSDPSETTASSPKIAYSILTFLPILDPFIMIELAIIESFPTNTFGERIEFLILPRIIQPSQIMAFSTTDSVDKNCGVVIVFLEKIGQPCHGSVMDVLDQALPYLLPIMSRLYLRLSSNHRMNKQTVSHHYLNKQE